MTFQAKYTAEQRATAVALVEELAAAAGKRRGAVAAAAAQLGLHPSIVAYWTSVALKSAPPAVKPTTPVRHGLFGLVWCGMCRRVMVPTRTQVGAAAFGCPDRCRRRTGLVVSEVERVIGAMIVQRLSVAGRPALNQLTVRSAADQAPRLLDRIVVGERPDDVRVQWRLAPQPVSTPCPGETIRVGPVGPDRAAGAARHRVPATRASAPARA